jgi:hypothetical protein
VKVMGSWEGIVAFSCRITRACRSVDTCCFILFSHGHLQAMDSWAKLSSPCQEGVVGSTTSPTVHNAEFVMQLKQWRAVRTQRRGQCARMNYILGKADQTTKNARVIALHGPAFTCSEPVT